MNKNNIRTGTVEGTGAAINVPVGFEPRVVRINNIDGDCFGYWHENMAVTALLSAGYLHKTVDSGSGTTDVSLVTSNGISIYSGAKPGAALTGTAYVMTKGSLAVSATNSLFASELSEGDVITITDGTNTQQITVGEISSNTALIAKEEAANTMSAGTALRNTGREAGFTIGTDSDLNVSGQTLVYEAIR